MSRATLLGLLVLIGLTSLCHANIGIRQNGYMGYSSYGPGRGQACTPCPSPGVTSNTCSAVAAGGAASATGTGTVIAKGGNAEAHCQTSSYGGSCPPRPRPCQPTCMILYQTIEIQTALNSCIGMSISSYQHLGIVVGGSCINMQSQCNINRGALGISSP
ncbi:hypothetical protein ACFL6U_12715 [Planctomycetota bacterium]